MIARKENVISGEILSLLKNYCGPKSVSKFLGVQKKMVEVEQHLLRRGGRRLLISSETGFSLESETAYDQLVTLCRKTLNDYEFQEVMLNVGDVFKSHGALQKAEQTYSNVMQYGEKTGHDEFVAEALLRRAEVYCRQGQWKESSRDLGQSRILFHRAKDPASVAKVENVLGTCFAEQGRLQPARKHYSKALREFERSQQKLMTGTVLMNLGIVYTIMGEWQKALEHYHRALSYFESAGDSRRIAEVHHNIGMTHLSKGDSYGAIRDFERCLTLGAKLQDPRLMGLAQLGKASAHFILVDYPYALAFCNLALENFNKTNDRLSIADAYKVKGMILREMKQYELAETHFQTSLRINEEHENMLNLGETYFEIGLLEKKRRRETEARKSFTKACRYFEKVGASSQFAKAKKHLG
jgi:tetratricopeptide (TPR) repeat protein